MNKNPILNLKLHIHQQVSLDEAVIRGLVGETETCHLAVDWHEMDPQYVPSPPLSEERVTDTKIGKEAKGI